MQDKLATALFMSSARMLDKVLNMNNWDKGRKLEEGSIIFGEFDKDVKTLLKGGTIPDPQGKEIGLESTMGKWAADITQSYINPSDKDEEQ